MMRASLLRSLTAVGFMLAVTTGSAQAQTKDIVDTAIDAGQFTTLTRALDAAGLVATLKGNGPFTVFAPTDAAFAKLPPGTVASLLEPANRDELRRILTSHVVAGKVTSADVVNLNAAETVSGHVIDVNAGSEGVTVGGAMVATADIMASNGVIHVIDAVILPADGK